MRRFARLLLITVVIVVFAQLVQQSGGVRQALIRVATALASVDTRAGEP